MASKSGEKPSDSIPAERNGVHAGWSNPCFEIWMYAYFGEMPAIRESYICCNRFADKFEKVTGQKYLKNGRDVYRKLVQYGDFEQAVVLAEIINKTERIIN